MKALVQRVKKASVTVDGEIVSKINHGFLIFLGVENGDSHEQADYLAKKVANLRVFEDDAGKMNLSIKDKQGEIIVVSQFTLAADCSKGNRPSFVNAARPETANPLYEYFVERIKGEGINTGTGVFQAHMDVELINDGPITIMLER